MEREITNEIALQTAIGEIRQAYAKDGRVKLKWTTGRKRSINQNDLSHVWYAQMARELPQESGPGWRSFCKLHFGVPILRMQDSDFRAFYDGALLGLTYEQKRAAMAYVPVTSLMTKEQLSQYLEAVREHFATLGCQLQWPEVA